MTISEQDITSKGPYNGNNSRDCFHLVHVVLLTKRVKDDVDLIEHVHHLHGRNVDADFIELHHVAEQDGYIWENLARKGRNSHLAVFSSLP